MRRLGRWMLNGLTVLSLLLCVAAVIFWATDPMFGQWRLSVNDLQIWAMSTRPLSDPGVAALPDYNIEAFGFADSADHGPPEAIRRQFRMPPVYTRMVEIPLWPLAAPFFIWAWRAVSWFLAVERMREAMATNRCRSCNYDLTANVSGICPECGSAIARTT